jgi:hypothetical protein
VSIYDNVAYNVSGHAFYVGDQSQNNAFERNLGSQTKTIGYSSTISGENDYDAAAFFVRYPPNSFVSNVASGNAEHGFYFAISNWMVRAEVSAITALFINVNIFMPSHPDELSFVVVGSKQQFGFCLLVSFRHIL